MENEEKGIGLIENENFNTLNAFKPEFDAQKLENNKNFQNWKQAMIDKYGIKGKLYKCPDDKIFFYTSDEENGRVHESEGICPLCKNKVCYFCKKKVGYDWIHCCLKRKFVRMKKEGKDNLNAKMSDLGDYEKAFLKYFLIPGLNIIFFIGIFFNITYYKLIMVYEGNHSYPYESFLHQNYLRFSIILALNGLTSIVLSFIFLIFGIIFSIILLILILFKTNYFMFLIGFFHDDWVYIYKNYHNVLRICSRIYGC